MAQENLGTRKSGIYPPPKKSGIGLWVVLGVAAVALVLFLAFGGRRGDQDATRGTPSGMGRRGVDDRTVRPQERPAERPSEEVQGLPGEPRGVNPSGDDLPPPAQEGTDTLTPSAPAPGEVPPPNAPPADEPPMRQP